MKEQYYSFDIFDTLLLRPYANPQDLWKELEIIEKAPGFAKARKEADAKSFKDAISRDGETTIEAAYDIIPQFKHLMQKEMDLERNALSPNPEMLKIWNEVGNQNKKRLIVSDMYLPSDFIQCVLRENGFDGWDGFYLSRDFDCRKSTGKLFEVMIQKEGVSPDNILHIGDNMISDVKIPKSLGIHTYYYKKVIDRLYEICPFARYIDSKLSGVIALGWHRFCLDHSNITYWHRLGFIIGGVLGYIYVKWIVETAKHLGKDRLMFVARDGYIWKAICETLYPEIETDYFYAPRLTSIAVLGATGSDPYAIKERQKYIDTHLKNVDVDLVYREYKEYLKQFDFNSNVAIIDGCSSGFSAQRLVEKIIGKNVFSFYLLSMAPKHCAASLYSTNLYALPFQMLSEFIFGAPEPPIKGVTSEGPVYADEVPEDEEFKIFVSPQIKEGAVECAKILKMYNVDVSPCKWLEYVDAFMNNLTQEDKLELKNAKNAGDVEQKKFQSLIYFPNSQKGFCIRKKWGIPIELSYSVSNYRYKIGISRKGLFCKKKDISIIVDTICNSNE